MLDPENRSDAHVIERLDSDVIMWLSSVRPDGRAHLVPVWFLWEDGTILIFSQPNNQKIRNIAKNPGVMLSLETIDQGDDVVLIEGRAELLEGEGAPTATMPAYARKYEPLFRRMKWSAEEMATTFTQAIRVTPTRFIAFQDERPDL